MSRRLFSTRMGFEPSKAIQLNEIDSDLRNDLYNIYLISLYNPVYAQYNSYGRNSFDHLFRIIWMDFYKDPLDEMPHFTQLNTNRIKKTILKEEWYRVYSLFELILSVLVTDNDNKSDVHGFVQGINLMLTRNNSGYRLHNNIFVPISNPEEIKEIVKLSETTLTYYLNEICQHLNQALTLMSLKPTPDYRNSVKESISMVGTIARTIEPSNDLAKALHELEQGKKINSQLSKGFKNLYYYTSGREGIRHELMDESNLDLETTRFFLIACSAFTNYLIEKGIKTGKLSKV